MSASVNLLCLLFFFTITTQCLAQQEAAPSETLPFELYPLLNDAYPDIPSPWVDADGNEYVVAVNRDNRYAVIPVTLSNSRSTGPQLVVDSIDFPELAEQGLHAEERLHSIQTITGRSLEEISELGRPNGLSQAGFLAADEDIISVLQGDNRLVGQMGLNHPQLAKPLFHVLNMMDADLSLNRWNMAIHKWDHIRYFYYNDQKVFVEAEDTKGGQQSIFNDRIEGAFYVKLWREFDPEELEYLEANYKALTQEELDKMKTQLSLVHTGEMQPQYIMRYGFYEGHTFWRADPLALSFIFGLKSLEELNSIFENRLSDILSKHHLE
jgi:hypothetical protein